MALKPDAASTAASSLKDKLAAALPEGFRCRTRYVHSPPKRVESLFPAPPGQEPEVTRLASHFLTLSISPQGSQSDESPTNVFVLGIEVLVYSTKRLTTLFVSKADSTGYLPQQKPSIAKAISMTFLKWLAAKEQQKHPSRKLVVSLFARSQSQYLFPGSAENVRKHVLDDRQLIKWWTRVLDPLFPNPKPGETSEQDDAFEYAGYITVPGYQGNELRRSFIPPSAGSEQHWQPGHPLLELAKTRNISPDAPPRCVLPRFPDDPKARFMQSLDDEAGIAEGTFIQTSPSKQKSGRWKSIRDIERFWEAMEFRQECSSGRVVGFIWLVMRPKQGEEIPNGESQKSISSVVHAPVSQEQPASINGSPSKRRRKPLSGPIIPRQPRLKGGSSSLTASSDLNDMVNTGPNDGLVISQEGYDKAMQSLLHFDFANADVAAQSTRKWISAVCSICGIQNDWSLEVVGRGKYDIGLKNGSSGGGQVNDLGGMIRKKRKAEDTAPIEEGPTVTIPSDQKPVVNVLGAGMVRKKPKPTT